MEGWFKEGKKVTGADVIVFVKGLRRFKDHKNSFALIDWMEKRGMQINVSIQAIRLDLISKAKGISEAEEFFSNLPESGKAQKNYAALLTNYCQEKSISKALSLYKKMQELNLASASLISNNIMTLYSKLGQPEKVIAHFQAMKAENISPDRVTYGLLVNSFGVLNDINAAERLIEEMKENGQVVPDWTIYFNLANFYNSSGDFKKS